MFGIQDCAKVDCHHQLTPSVRKRYEVSINKLKIVIEENNPLADKGDKLYNFMTKKVLNEKAKKSILEIPEMGDKAKKTFVEQRLNGDLNLWSPMKKTPLINWDDLCKIVKLKGKTTEIQLKASSTFLSRLLIITKSERNVDLQEAISLHEFNSINLTLMSPDGSLLPWTSKSDLIHALEDLCDLETTPSVSTIDADNSSKHLIVDAMAVVQALIHASNFTTCIELSNAFSDCIDFLLTGYKSGRIIFDNYHKKNTIKDAMRYGDNLMSQGAMGVKIKDTTLIKDTKRFMTNNFTKDELTLYLSEKAIKTCKSSIVTATRKDVLSNINYCTPKTPVSSHEEADTLMMVHALEFAEDGEEVDFFSQDTD